MVVLFLVTVKIAFGKAAALCGIYDELDSFNESELNRRCLALVNCVYADLYGALQFSGRALSEYAPMKSADEDIPLDDIIITDCLIYGVAMYIALSERDDYNQRMYAKIYEQKRQRYETADRYGEVADILP